MQDATCLATLPCAMAHSRLVISLISKIFINQIYGSTLLRAWPKFAHPQFGSRATQTPFMASRNSSDAFCGSALSILPFTALMVQPTWGHCSTNQSPYYGRRHPQSELSKRKLPSYQATKNKKQICKHSTEWQRKATKTMTEHLP